MQTKAQTGFTLIELLVVITIIVVLLALLTPALDKAIYRAELAVCAAGLRSIGTSTASYAAGQRRHYPRAAAGRLSQPYQIGQNADPSRDLRPLLEGFVPLKAWLDPLSGEVDLSYENNDPETMACASYTYFAGWKYANGPGLMCLGDRVGWVDQTSHTPETHNDRSQVLVTDLNGVHANNNQVYVSHPDDLGVTFIEKLENSPALIVDGVLDLTWILWRAYSSTPRGRVDLNFAMTDNSVVLYEKITGDWVADDFEAGDGTEFHAAPWSEAANNPNAKHFLPLR